MKMCSRCLSNLGSHSSRAHLFFDLQEYKSRYQTVLDSEDEGRLDVAKPPHLQVGLEYEYDQVIQVGLESRDMKPVSCRFVSTCLCEYCIGFQNLQTWNPSAQEVQTSEYSWFCQHTKTVRWRLSADCATKVRFAMWSSTTSDRRRLAVESHPC